MNLLRRLSHLQVLSGLATRLHLGTALRRAYYWWVTSPEGVEFCALGLSYRMRGLDPDRLRSCEWYVLYGERDFQVALRADLRPGESVLDVGANLGQFTLPLAKMVGEKGHVLSFEPVGAAFQQLLENVKLNGLTNVQVFRKALGEEDTEAEIFAGGGRSPSIVAPEDDTIYRSVSEKIEIVRGDTFFAREKLPIPHAVKIDVEGFEYAVLQGLRATLADPRCRLMCLEIHPHLLPSGVSAETITELLRSLGFEQFQTQSRRRELHVVALKPAPVS